MLHNHCNIFQTLHSMLLSFHLANPLHWDTVHLLCCKDAVNTQSTDWAKITVAQCSGVQWLRVVDDVSLHQVIQYSSVAFGSISVCTVRSKRWENNSITALLYCCFAPAFLWFIKLLGGFLFFNSYAYSFFIHSFTATSCIVSNPNWCGIYSVKAA